MEDEKAVLRRSIRALGDHVVDRVGILQQMAGATGQARFAIAAMRIADAYSRQVGILEDRLIELETTEIRAGMWYKRTLRPGEAREILDRSLRQGMGHGPAADERASPG